MPMGVFILSIIKTEQLNGKIRERKGKKNADQLFD
jgi:hypothetical protein